MELNKFRILIVDDEFAVIADFKEILCPRGSDGESGASPDGAADLFAPTLAHPDFPEIELTTCQGGVGAIASVRDAMKESNPFAVAFVDMSMPGGIDGVQTAEQLRALDRDLNIVLVTSFMDQHPMDLVERIGPADKLLILQKPFQAPEVQQMALSLCTRWKLDRTFGLSRRDDQSFAAIAQGGVKELLEHFPAGVMIFDRRDNLMMANEEMGRMAPEISHLLLPGMDYEQILQETSERLLPDDTLYLEGAWVRDRLEWHAKSGGVLEQRLKGNRWHLVVEAGGPAGETYCLHIDTTELKQRESNKAVAGRMAQMAQTFGAFCKQFEIDADEAGSPLARGPFNLVEKAPEWAPDDAYPSIPENKVLKGLAGKMRAIAQIQKLDPEEVGLNRLVGEVYSKGPAGNSPKL